MPRGDNPNSRKNLKPNSERTPKERKALAKKAGKKSGEVRGQLKSFREMDAESTTPEERQQMLDQLKQMVAHGNLKALELYLKIIGESDNKVTANVTVQTRNPLGSMSLEAIKELINDD